MKKEITERGFALIQFKDSNKSDCSLQESSSVVPQIWLGIDDPKVSIFEDEHVKGKYVTITLPKNMMIHSRLLLDMNQVRALLPHLRKFARKGEI